MTEVRIGQLWRHKKRGTTYEVTQVDQSLQCATNENFEEAFDDEYWVSYRSIDTGAKYLRLTNEFIDGRFELVKDVE
jgi:hypothetical protein